MSTTITAKFGAPVRAAALIEQRTPPSTPESQTEGARILSKWGNRDHCFAGSRRRAKRCAK